MDYFLKKQLVKYIHFIFLVPAVALVFVFVVYIPNYLEAYLLFASTFFGVFMALFIEDWRQEIKSIRQLQHTLALIYRDYETNIEILQAIKDNLSNLLNFSLSNSRQIIKALRQYVDHFNMNGYLNSLSNAYFFSLKDDDLYNKVQIAYRELQLVDSLLLQLDFNCNLDESLPKNKKKTFDIENNVEKALKRVEVAIGQHELLNTALWKELNKYGVRLDVVNLSNQ